MDKKLMLNYVTALTNMYGLVKMDKVVDIYNRQNEDKITVDQLKKVATQSKLEDHSVVVAVDFFFQDYMDSEDISRFISSHQNKPYYIPDQNNY